MAADLFKLPLEAQIQYQILRQEVQEAEDLERLREVSLKLINLMELQRKTFNGLMRHQGPPLLKLPPQRPGTP
jgi:hypothetical protein